MCWKDSSAWGMANSMHDVVLAITKHVIQKANFFSLNCDEFSQQSTIRAGFPSTLMWLKTKTRRGRFTFESTMNH